MISENETFTLSWKSDEDYNTIEQSQHSFKIKILIFKVDLFHE